MTDKDFEVFYQQEDPKDAPSTSHCLLRPAQVSSSQEGTNIPEGMGFEEKTPDLLALLTVHAGGSSPIVMVVPQPPTPALMRASSVDATNKKRKRAQDGKGTEGPEEGEVTQSSHQPLTKEAQTKKGQQKKNTPSRTSREAKGNQPPKPSV